MSMNLGWVASEDGATFTDASKITNGYSDYGLSMVNWRGELYGIMVSNYAYNNKMFATKYKAETGWKLFLTVSETHKSKGRVAVAVLEDRFYICYRGMDDSVNLLYTDDMDDWIPIRLGASYSKTNVAPGMIGFDGKLWIAATNTNDNSVMYCVTDSNGKMLNTEKGSGFMQVDNKTSKTESALHMNVLGGVPYLFHTGTDNSALYVRSFKSTGVAADWASSEKVDAYITSGVTTVSWKYNQMCVSYRGPQDYIIYRTFDGTDWTTQQVVPGARMTAQTGMGTWAGRVIISFGAPKGFFTAASKDYIMCEKPIFGTVSEVEEEWDVKWKNQNAESKSIFQKMFCL